MKERGGGKKHIQPEIDRRQNEDLASRNMQEYSILA